MNNTKSTFLFLLLLFSPVIVLPQEVSVKVDPQLQYQEIEGWGASLCWWAHMVGQWDEEKIDEIVDWITSPEGLNMNIFRYNIGGGDNPAHYTTDSKNGHMASGKGVRAEMEGFKASETDPYDWTADAGQRKIMLKIKEKRPDAIFEAFSNSPPYWMTYSGCSSGNNPASADNLKPEYYDAFCDYLIDVCKHYKEEYGIEFKTLEPFNEALSSYWGYLGGQEGCHFNASSQIKLIKALHPKLQESGLKTVISASDETNLSDFITVMNAYISDGNTLSLIGQINTHTYSASNAQRTTVLDLSEKIGKTFWQSETGPSGFSTSGFANNIDLAQRLFDDMRLMRPSAWLDWQLMEEGNDTWCQIRCNFKGQSYYRVKNFYVRMQITRFIKQGYTIIRTDNDNVLAAISPEKDELVLCFINNSGSQKTFSCDLSSFDVIGENAVSYLTTSSKNCEQQQDIAIESNTVEVNTTNLSVSTLIIPVVFIDKRDFSILNEITFENERFDGFESATATLSIEDNSLNPELNNSSKTLSARINNGDSIIYKFEKTFISSEHYRYLHVMTQSETPQSIIPGNPDSDVITLNLYEKWTDTVIDLGTGNPIDSLIFSSAFDNAHIRFDNLLINSDSSPREIKEEISVIDFESDNYLIGGMTDNILNCKIEENTEITGLNVLGRFLSFTTPYTGSAVTTDTLVIKLLSPLRITEDSRYLHLMIKQSGGTKANISCGNISEDKSFTSNVWRDLVVDMESASGEIVYEVKISPYITTKLDSKVWFDNIRFNDDSNPETYSFQQPETGIPYIIMSRNSNNVLEQSDNTLIQAAYQSGNDKEEQQWIFTGQGNNYTISNKKTGKLISDDNTYYAAMKESSADLSGQTYSIVHIENGFARIVSSRTSKAIDVENEKTSAGAAIGFWTYSGGYHQQWALIKLNPDNTGITAKSADPDSPTLQSGKTFLHLTNLPPNSAYAIYSFNGMLIEKGKCTAESKTITLSKGIYIVKITGQGKEYTLKGIVW